MTLNDWPDVTPVFVFLETKILCPTEHSSLRIYGTPKVTEVEYDVTEALINKYDLHNVYIYPKSCFSSTAVYILDSNGV